MKFDRNPNIEEEFNNYVLAKFPGFRLVSRAGVVSSSNLSYNFSLEPVLSEAVRGIDPSEVYLLDYGEDRVTPFLGFYSIEKKVLLICLVLI